MRGSPARQAGSDSVSGVTAEWLERRMAVYTEIGDDELRAFIARLRHRRGAVVQGHRRGGRELELPARPPSSGTFILTLYEKRVAPGDLPFFIALMDHLAHQGVACPTPVRAQDGAALRELCGRPAAIVTFLDGMWPRRIEPFHCAGVGGALARLHRAGASFAMTRPNDLGRRRLASALCRLRRRAPTRCRPGSPPSSATSSSSLEAAWPRSLPSGVIHADLFPDNVFFRDHELSGLIDFYFACTDFSRLRPRDLPQRLVLRGRRQLQRHQGAAAGRALPRRAAARARPRSRRCRCWRAAARCAFC